MLFRYKEKTFDALINNGVNLHGQSMGIHV